MVDTLLTALHIIVALTLIIVVLFQHGKGASIGASFGGSSQTLFGPRGPATALAKITTVAAILFMLTSMGLSVMGGSDDVESVIETPTGAVPVQTTLPPGGPTSGATPGVDAGGPVEAPAVSQSGGETPVTGGPTSAPAEGADAGGPVDGPVSTPGAGK